MTASSAVLEGELNPENAGTEYFFEYALSAGSAREMRRCTSRQLPRRAEHRRQAVRAYGTIGAALEITGLRPSTTYSYRLAAENENTGGTEKLASVGPVATFTTAPAPSPAASTGAAQHAARRRARRSPATIEPDGAPVTYSFELGVYEGAANTRTGSSPPRASNRAAAPVEVSLALTGLQPGTTYAYRIAISSGYIDNETHTLEGQPLTFTTGGLPAVLQAPTELAQLPTPGIAFPVATGEPKAKKPAGGTGRKHKNAKRRKAKAKKAHETGGRKRDRRRARG